MKLYTAARAPNPRRVAMFMAEKGIAIDLQAVDLGKGEHRSESYLALNPFGRVPALELDDGRILTETRAICTYLEGLAFIEMADRRMELHLLAIAANSIRHGHPGFASLENPQFPEFGASQGDKFRENARWLDRVLAVQPFVAGQRFTIADITAFCAMDFARGLMKFRPSDAGLANLQAWRDRIADRPSASAGT